MLLAHKKGKLTCSTHKNTQALEPKLSYRTKQKEISLKKTKTASETVANTKIQTFQTITVT